MKKEKILMFVIGVLVGAIITSGVFLIYENVKQNNVGPNNQTHQMGRPNGGGMAPNMPNGEMGTPPDMQLTEGAPSQDGTNSQNTSTNTNKQGKMKGDLKENTQIPSDTSSENEETAPSAPKINKKDSQSNL